MQWMSVCVWFVDEVMCSLWMIVICGLPLIACDCSRLWIVVS